MIIKLDKIAESSEFKNKPICQIIETSLLCD